MAGLPEGEKTLEDMCNRLDTIPACDRQTDGRTDILPRHSPRYAYMRRAVKIDARNNMGDYNMSTKLKEKLDEMEEIKK